jgi:hypothetical protein
MTERYFLYILGFKDPAISVRGQFWRGAPSGVGKGRRRARDEAEG